MYNIISYMYIYNNTYPVGHSPFSALSINRSNQYSKLYFMEENPSNSLFRLIYRY